MVLGGRRGYADWQYSSLPVYSVLTLVLSISIHDPYGIRA